MVEVGTYKYSCLVSPLTVEAMKVGFCIPCLNYAIHVSLRSLFSTLDSAVLVRLCVLWLLYEYHGLSIKMFANRAEAHVPY